jgi:hypothetical protein
LVGTGLKRCSVTLQYIKGDRAEDTYGEPSVFDPAEVAPSFTQILRPDSSVVDVIAPDCAEAKVAKKNVERKKVAVKLAIIVICRRLDIRVKTSNLGRNQNKDRPKDTLTSRAYHPEHLPENPEPEY